MTICNNFYDTNLSNAIRNDNLKQQYNKLENDLLSAGINVTETQLQSLKKSTSIWYRGAELQNSKAAIPEKWRNQQSFFHTPSISNKIKSVINKNRNQNQKEEAEDDDDEMKQNEKEEAEAEIIEKKQQRKLFSSSVC